MFDKLSEKLKNFLMQIKLYLLFNLVQFQTKSDKILYILLYL